VMFVEYGTTPSGEEDDPTVWSLDRQYMLGDSLLVAPIFSYDGVVQYYLPRGKWTNFFTNETVQGPCWRKEKHGFETLPFMVREGTVLALGPPGEKRVVYDYSSDLEIRLYHPTVGNKAELVDVDGKKVGEIKVEKADKDGSIKLILPALTKKYTVLVNGKKLAQGSDKKELVLEV